MKDYFLSRRPRLIDALLVVAGICCLATMLHLNVSFNNTLSSTTEISLGYSAKEWGGKFFVNDDGHSRLLCFDAQGKILFEIVNPSAGDESSLYIDDFIVDENAVYLSASEWNGMLLDRELVVKYSMSGEYLETLTERNYAADSLFVNKHRFYGITLSGDQIAYAEAFDDKIQLRVGNSVVYTLSYENAFNAVSDIKIDGSDLIIMNKNGIIQRYDSSGSQELIYSTRWPGEEKRIPFRLDWRDGTTYFTDIRSRQALKADPENQTAIVLAEDTDSQTVALSENGKGLLLMNSDGLCITGEENQTYSVLKKSDKEIRAQYIFLGLLVLLVVLSFVIVLRLVMCMLNLKLSSSQKTSLITITLVAAVAIGISYLMMDSFKSSFLGKIREQIMSNAYIVSSVLAYSDIDIDSINEAKDFGGEAYNDITDMLERFFPMDVEFFRTTYCNILRLDEGGESGFGFAYLDQSIGVYFPLDEVETGEVQRVYAEKQPVWNDAVADVSGTYLSVKIPVISKSGEVAGAVAVGADTFVIDGMISDMQKMVLLSISAVMLLIWIVSTEVTSFLASRVRYLQDKLTMKNNAVPGHMIQVLVFAVFAAYNMTASFMPMYIIRNSSQLPDAWRGICATLPITMNLFMLGFMSLFCAGAIRKMGIRKVFILSMGCSALGNLMIFLLPGYLPILVGQMMDGIGVGMLTNAVYITLTYLPYESARRSGFATYNTASLAGINFGMILGGLMASNIGQSNVFAAVVILWLLLVVLGTYLIKQLTSVLEPAQSERKGNSEVSGISFWRFITAKPIWSFIVLIQNPYIVFNALVFYVIPVFCESVGYNETMISLFLMMYSQVAVMLGNFMPGLLQRAGRAVLYLALGLNVIATGVFAVTRNTTGMMIAMLTLGVCASFAKPFQQTYYLSRKPAYLYGEDKAMGIYNFSESIGDSLGPMILGGVMSSSLSVILVFLGGILGCGGLHFLLNARDK